MKKKIFSIAKKNGVEVLEYESRRTDLGFQSFKIKVKYPSGILEVLDEGYIPGEPNGREHVLAYFEEMLSHKPRPIT